LKNVCNDKPSLFISRKVDFRAGPNKATRLSEFTLILESVFPKEKSQNGEFGID
jgi:hypothetical protein